MQWGRDKLTYKRAREKPGKAASIRRKIAMYSEM